MTALPEVSSYLDITGEFPPSEASTLLRMQPDHTARRGDRQGFVRFDVWSIHTGCVDTADATGKAIEIIDRIHPAAEGLRMLKHRYPTISVAVTVRVSIPKAHDAIPPSFDLPPEYLRKLADIGVGLTLDYSLEPSIDVDPVV